jgi:hypothetical protein
VQVKVDESGVSLFWAAPAENRQLPVIAYAVERDSSGQSSAPVTAKPVVPGITWDPKIPLVLDRNAPGNDTLTYHVYSPSTSSAAAVPAPPSASSSRTTTPSSHPIQ